METSCSFYVEQFGVFLVFLNPAAVLHTAKKPGQTGLHLVSGERRPLPQQVGLQGSMHVS